MSMIGYGTEPEVWDDGEIWDGLAWLGMTVDQIVARWVDDLPMVESVVWS